MNIELLQRVRDQIAAQPEHFNLDWFAVFSDDVIRESDESGGIPLDVCGTTFCIAGTAVVLSDGPQVKTFAYDYRAAELLGLNGDQAPNLFYAAAGSVWSAHAEEFGWASIYSGRIADWSEITAEQAVIVLDRIITGEVKL